MSIKQLIEDSEKEFDDKYGSFELCERISKVDRNRLLYFITQSQLALLEEVKKMIESRKISEWDSVLCNECKQERGQERNEIKTEYNKVLDDIIKELTIEDFNCECKEPEPDDSVDVGKYEGRFNRCKVCKGRVWH